MKRILYIAIACLIFILVGCNDSTENQSDNTQNSSWISEITDEDVSVSEDSDISYEESSEASEESEEASSSEATEEPEINFSEFE